MNTERVWLIWSHEHKAWWRADGWGYVRRSNRAGRFTYDEAFKMCQQANRYSKHLEEEMIHVDKLPLDFNS